MIAALKSTLLTSLLVALLAVAGSFALSPTAQAATSKVNCPQSGCIDPASDPNDKCDNDRCDFIKKYINPTIQLLSGLVGILAVISLIVAGIQYSSSEGDPQKVSKAKGRIVTTLVSVVAFFFLYAFLQFIVPGGIFK